MSNLTTRQVAEKLLVSKSTVIRRVKAGELPAVKAEDGHWIFDEQKVESYVRYNAGLDWSAKEARYEEIKRAKQDEKERQQAEIKRAKQADKERRQAEIKRAKQQQREHR